MPDLAPHYLLEVTRPERLDQLTIHVEKRSREVEGRSANVLSRHIKQNIGISAEIELCSPGALGRSAGKAVRVKDLRPK